MSAGQDFVKKIGPLGSILFLLLFIAFLIFCFMPPKQAVDSPETPTQESDYDGDSPAVQGSGREVTVFVRQTEI